MNEDEAEDESARSSSRGPGESGDGSGTEDHSGPGPGGDGLGDVDHSGPGRAGDEDEENCGTDALVTGARVHEAELEITSAGAVWEEVELIR